MKSVASTKPPLLDQKERSRALTDHGATLLVEAGAGSGKTSLLAGRVVLMLAGGIEPRHIAAITFTELAAGELFTRILRFIDELLDGKIPYNLEAVRPDGLNQRERANLESARGSVSELTVSTIHGFCQRLVRPYPVEASVDPGARVMDEAQANLAWESLLNAFLREKLDDETARSALASFATHCEHFESEIAEIANFLKNHRTARAAEVCYDAKPLKEFTKTAGAFGRWLSRCNYVEPTTAVLADEIAEMAQYYETALVGKPDGATLVELALAPKTCSAHRKDRAWRRWGRKGKWQRQASAHGRSKAEGERLSAEGENLYEAVGDSCTALQRMIAAAAFGALAQEFDELLRRFARYKRDAALLDFDDLLVHARDLLKTNEPVRRALAARYSHVLVDEFQDTDPIQAEILWRLCGEGAARADWRKRQIRPGALFLVADPKQAIYRFRGADVDTYLAARQAIRKQSADNVLEISSNFRSLKPILQWVNGTFASPLSADKQPGFKNLTATRDTRDNVPRVAGLEVKVAVTGDKPSIADCREAEARAVAELCRRLIGSCKIQPNEQERLVGPGDIAMLAPTGTDLWRYEAELERAGVPVASQAGKNLFHRQEIHDLIAITRTLANSRDTLAFGALMRGPLVGLTEEELLDINAALAEDGKEKITRLVLWTDPNTIRHAYARNTIQVLQGLARRARSTTPFLLLSQAVDELRLRPILALQHPISAERALANVDLFLEMARAYDVRGLRAFANDMRSKWEDSDREIEGRPDAEQQAVHIITIHSAKGLEWPVVIPINLMTKPQDRLSLVHDRGTDSIRHCLGDFIHEACSSAKDEEEQQLARERIRLLYVACTRAADLLIIPRLSEGPSHWLKLADISSDRLPGFDYLHLDKEMPTRPPEPRNQQDAVTFATEAELVASASRKLKWHQPSRHEIGEEAVSAEPASVAVFMEGEPLRSVVLGGPLRGVVLHKLMEEILTGETSADASVLEERAAELLRQLGETTVKDPAIGFAPAEMAQTVLRTLALPQVAQIRSRLLPELSVYSQASLRAASSSVAGVETLVSGVADAIALDARGAVEAIVDWKSDINPPTSRRKLYQQQLSHYIDATEASYGLIVYMSHGQVEELRRPQLAEAT